MKQTIFWALGASLIVGGATWFARGLYDETFLYEGRFHVVNATDTEREIVLTFPSGNAWEATLSPSQTADFVMKKTGEGAIQVQSDGRDLGTIGYVTSYNNLSAIVIRRDSALFSQIFAQESDRSMEATNSE